MALNTIFRQSPAVPSPVLNTYWKFAAERQEVFFRRFNKDHSPWSSDPILQTYKFTNAYRASDRVSQYLIRNVIYNGDMNEPEIFFRIILFKFFNKIETWQLLCRHFDTPSYSNFSVESYNEVLSKAINSGKRIYSAAYIMPSGGKLSIGGRKHRMHLNLLDQMMKDQLYDQMSKCKTMGQAFELIRSYPTIGDFLAYQYVTDLNYSPLTNFSEMEFVVPGPGSLGGIRKCFSSLGGLTEAELIKWVTEKQEDAFCELGIKFHNLWGRSLQLIDCQNLFCEVDKYARVAHPEYNGEKGRTRIKQKFSSNQNPLEYWYPPKWNLNKHIPKRKEHVQSLFS